MAAITAATITLAAPAGVGGGGVLVPMYLIFGPQHARTHARARARATRMRKRTRARARTHTPSASECANSVRTLSAGKRAALCVCVWGGACSPHGPRRPRAPTSCRAAPSGATAPTVSGGECLVSAVRRDGRDGAVFGAFGRDRPKLLGSVWWRRYTVAACSGGLLGSV